MVEGTSRTVVEKGGSRPGLIVVASSLVLAALPIFLVGGLAVQIREDLGFDEAALGAAVTIAFALGAVSAPIGGRLADRVGPRASLYTGALLSVVSSAGVGLLADDWATLVIFLCFSGVAVALTDPGLAILVGVAIPAGRHGLAFGVKEASIPAATLIAGLAVPVVALTVGWRWAFAIGLLPLAAVLANLPRLRAGGGWRVETQAETAAVPRRFRTIALSAVAGALGTAAASGVGVFLTESAVAMGTEEGSAGLILAVGSVAGVVARICTGLLADRRPGHYFAMVAVMLAVGAATMALGGLGSPWMLVVGAIGAFTGGWAWTGIFFLSLIRVSPARPGSVAGIGAASLGVGNATGPLLFGLVAQSFSFQAAWWAASAAAAVGALFMALAHRAARPH